MSRREINRREFIQSSALATLGAAALPGLSRCSDTTRTGASDGARDLGPTADQGVPEEGGGSADQARPAGDPFMVVALPDTQRYADLYPHIFESQTQWIADNRVSEKIAFVTHLGDIVNNGPNLRQWDNAARALQILDAAGVPYGTCLGNHDLQYSDNEYQYPPGVNHSCSEFTDIDCDAQQYLDLCGPLHFRDRPWYGGSSPSGQSNFQQFTAEGQKFLFLHLAVDPRSGEVAWAQQVIDGHPDAAVHLSTHRYIYDFRMVQEFPFPLSGFVGGRYNSLLYSFDQSLIFEGSVGAETLFNTFVKVNPSIFMVQCGHVDGELRQVSTNDAGLPVHELMVDFQDSVPRGGDGWMRLMSFDVVAGRIQVQTYSPATQRFRTKEESFEQAMEMMRMGIDRFGNLLGEYLDLEAVKKELSYYLDTPEGQAEYFDLLFAEGRRDSEFTLEVDFSSYHA